MILPVDKPPGWTPLEALDALRARTPACADEPMVYAGRLDPMAEGVLLVLTGADRFDLPHHLTHDKTYEAEILFGVGSDTHDALGRLAVCRDAPSIDACREAIGALAGTHTLPLPVWSAYRVAGRPLHAWARDGRLHEITIPRRDMVVHDVCEVSARLVSAASVLSGLRARIGRVRGEFRQAEVLEDWAHAARQQTPFVSVRATLTVKSGTYVRALAHAVGDALGVGALLFALRRTRVGPYVLAEAQSLEGGATTCLTGAQATTAAGPDGGHDGATHPRSCPTDTARGR